MVNQELRGEKRFSCLGFFAFNIFFEEAAWSAVGSEYALFFCHWCVFIGSHVDHLPPGDLISGCLRLSPAISRISCPHPLPAISGYLRLSPDISGYLRLSPAILLPAISGYLRLSPAISGYLRLSPAISGYLPAISRISCRFFLLSCCYQPCFLPKKGPWPSCFWKWCFFIYIYIYMLTHIISHFLCVLACASRRFSKNGNCAKRAGSERNAKPWC